MPLPKTSVPSGTQLLSLSQLSPALVRVWAPNGPTMQDRQVFSVLRVKLEENEVMDLIFKDKVTI